MDLNSLKSGFLSIWQQFVPDNGLILTYNTGRLYDDVNNLIKKKILPEPHYIIGGVGTHIYDYQQKKVLKEFSEILEEGWDSAIVEKIIRHLNFNIVKQPQKYQHFYKRSYYLENASEHDLSSIKTEFAASSLEVNVVYSGNKYLDILPKWANKGNALQWLLNFLDVSIENTIVAGDSGNDIAMFDLEGVHGIVVGNAREELYLTTKYRKVYHSERPQHAGVIEGLIFYEVLPSQALDMLDNSLDTNDASILAFQNIDPEIAEKRDDKIEFIRDGYKAAIKALKLNISPLGFLACPIEQNIARGTDANYHSVWARDGAISILGSLSLVEENDIRICIKNTFLTLLNNISLNGQIPSNVRLNDEQPDYSGVGGICSIDSGLWVVIAFFEYIRATEDMEFLHEHIFALQRAMDWLSAHDGNNDALLEIPEAGDWTDLFGRSYHVLYDEILWYRANVSFARLMEMLGNYEQAGDYMRWSQVIKKEILDNFWPSTQASVSFAEKQFSLGDTKYLVAQITPFDFSWRMDSFGNILAYLYDVSDYDKAMETLRFIIGVGMNEPYPIRNVYPAVMPGDPDWRPYYTVNLLNLPHHYHNGGIWPFVGGFWVQFLVKAGQRELAVNELYKLALLNKGGIQHEWEFNEWAHGETGRPMGKVFQAWSAAQYIAACHHLKIN